MEGSKAVWWLIMHQGGLPLSTLCQVLELAKSVAEDAEGFAEIYRAQPVV